MLNLIPADIFDSADAQLILDAVRKRWPWLKHLFADGAYDGTKFMDKAAFLDFVIAIIRRSDTVKGFEVLQRAGGSNAPSRRQRGKQHGTIKRNIAALRGSPRISCSISSRIT
jgi:hypothetical protein